ncbi:MAG: hypothetical protein H7Z16_11650 [Pyrinomonadaceae bacterium]|nr:hypothetical protein [Pyrinomonadaceae bacterium]
MSTRISLSVADRSIYSVVISFTALFLFMLATAGRITAEANTSDLASDPSAERRECASTANVRWLPHSTITINYARGEFTEAERTAFHGAISLWQKALLELKLGIVLKESGEIEKDAKPGQSQIIVKRDYSMDSGHYGKIEGATRPDNYLDRAFILINGSLRKRNSLRKTMLHELGHAFGLKDCPNCRSGATVMNYFSQPSVVGFNIGKAGRRISDKPTGCDIAAVANGYRQSPPALAANPTEEWQPSRTLMADETMGVVGATRGDVDGAGANNIIAQYLIAKAANEMKAIAPSFQSTAVQEVYTFALGPYSNPTLAHQFHTFSGGPYFKSPAAKRSFVLRFAPYFKSAPTVEGFRWMMPPPQPASAEKSDRPSASSDLKVASLRPARVNSIESPLEASPATEAKVVSVSPGNQRVLTQAEKIEFESHIPALLGKEAETMDELNNYTFTRDVRIQTIDHKGRVSGEYRRTSDIVFDDSGARIERGLSFSKSTLRRLKISPEYVEDFSGVQLKGFELSKRDHYRIEPFMTETVDGIRMRVYRMTPLNLNAERAAQTRVFYGYVWVEESTGRIMKIGGCALPDGKQRFPLFETERALVDGKHVFPLHTIADDYLVFSSHKVHVRMLITYSNYKRFESRVKVVEVDD